MLATVRGHDLEEFLLGSGAPMKYAELGDEELERINPEYKLWQRQDQLLVSWLFSSMTEGVLARMVKCESAAQVWSTIQIYFAAQIRAKVSQFKSQLQRTKKNDLSMNEYLLKIRKLVDLLNLVGNEISVKDHVESICEGLTEEYETFVVSTIARNDEFTVEEIEALLLSHEARIERKNEDLDLPRQKSSSLMTANYSSANSFQDRRRGGGRGGYLSHNQSYG